MKFEKLNENKIRITLTIQDLAEKEIDFHVFMSNSAEAQDVLLDMLEQAKKETGFDPEDYNLKVEALVMADTNFIFTITKLPPEEKSKISKRKFTVKRKNIVPMCWDINGDRGEGRGFGVSNQRRRDLQAHQSVFGEQ